MTKLVPITTIETLTQAAYNLELGIDNHIDFYTCLDEVGKTVSECYAISKINFNDTIVFLIGGYGSSVESVSMPQHFYKKDVLEAMNHMQDLIYEFIDSSNQDKIGVDYETSKINWNVIPHIKNMLETAEQYVIE